MLKPQKQVTRCLTNTYTHTHSLQSHSSKHTDSARTKDSEGPNLSLACSHHLCVILTCEVISQQMNDGKSDKLQLFGKKKNPLSVSQTVRASCFDTELGYENSYF